jgi:hypothetical protein
LNEKKIGYHRVTIKPEESQKIVETESSFNVKILMLSVYQYRHTAREVWRDNCLAKILTRTDDNGKKLFVNGERQRNQFEVESTDGIRTIRGCVKSFAYWNPELLEAEYLLNSQNGNYHAVKVIRKGKDAIQLGDKAFLSYHIQIVSEKFTIDLWYSSKNEWLALSTTTERGEKLRYERR